MVQTAREAFSDADILLMLVEADSDVHSQDMFLIETLSEINIPVFLVINKIDLIEKKLLLPLIDKFRTLYNYREIFLVSAIKGDGLDDLLQTIKNNLPEGPQYFTEDTFTDVSERFIAAEFIREKIMLLTKQEVPYATAVEIDTFKENEEKNLIRISATITVEKESQKAIMIGKKGLMLKNIGTQARLEMEKLFASKVFLELFVRVKKDWTSSDKMLQEFGLLKV
jgi:GTP-binding protein Era